MKIRKTSHLVQPVKRVAPISRLNKRNQGQQPELKKKKQRGGIIDFYA